MNASPRGRERLALLLATMFGAGRAPIVPGTFGTLAALPPVIAAGLFLPAWAYAMVTVAVILVAIASSDTTARLLGVKDPGAIVIDEAAGLFVTLLGLPIVPWTVIGGFLLFRIFDITKPPPARRAERLPGGIGIVLDDLIAGLYANLALRIAGFLYEHFVA